MELPTPGHRRPPGGSDRISALPDDMLLQILDHLRCARAAAHASGISRWWRDLWRHLPELSFCDISADALEDALGLVACPALSLLEVDMPKNHTVGPACAASLLRAAARLAPANLVFSVSGGYKDRHVPIEIPCFERATLVKLRVFNLSLTASGAEFPLLERLSVAGACFDTAELVLRCPRLRVFKVSSTCDLKTVKVHSPTIEELAVTAILGLHNIDIVTPVLKNFTLSAGMSSMAGITFSFSAPMVENHRWHDTWCKQNVGFGKNWRLHFLSLMTEENFCVLNLDISAYFSTAAPPADWSFSQEIAPLPSFSVLVLQLETGKHVFGQLVSHLLGICSTVQNLTVAILQNLDNETCSPNCACDQPPNWRNEIISLTALKEVKIAGFGGTDHELDFLKLLFRCSASMKSMTVVWAPEFSPTCGDREEIFSIFEENPDVNCRLRMF